MPRKGSRNGRRMPRGRMAGAVVTAGTALALVAPAGASASALTTTRIFSATGAEQSFVVPAGISRISVLAIAGAGGDALGTGGQGAQVSAALPVTPGETLYLEVGGTGGSATATTAGAAPFGGGGAGAVGNASVGYGSGAGGGASDVRTCPIDNDCADGSASSLASRLLVAAGGGGGAGGNGGDAGLLGGSGADGQAGSGNSPGLGGGGATTTAGGTAGASGCGTAGRGGTLGVGGAGGGWTDSRGAGAGGGGGLYGGGGGYQGCSTNTTASGGAGGGGSSWVEDSATNTSSALAGSQAPEIAITYAVPTASPDATLLTFGSQPQDTLSDAQTVTLTNRGSAPLAVRGEQFTGSDAQDFVVGASTCGDLVQPGDSCTVDVRFSPRAAGARTATLTVLTNASSDPTVSLTGTGGALPAGAAGAAGAPGATGATGPAGPAGPTGPAGRDATISCQVSGRHVTCRVLYGAASRRRPAKRHRKTHHMAKASSLVHWTLAGRGRARHGAARLAGGRTTLPAAVTWRLAPGRYTLTVVHRVHGRRVTSRLVLRVV